MDSNQANGGPPSPHLETATVTPIAELGPHLSGTATRSTRGVITIVWPYSIVTKSLSFVLAEPDFRLRRQKGQVRVTFVGSSAKAVADASLGGGDDVLLSLDGVEWAESDAPGAPGTTLEWQARFSSGALLRAEGAQFKEPKVIRVDPTAERLPDAEPSLPIPIQQPIESPPIRPATPEPILPAKRRIQEDLEAGEYASPAFVKRARVSYGSLFEGAFNLFDGDPEAGRGRKRTKFGRDSRAWRYTSQSRSPEPEDAEPTEEPSDQAEVSSGEAPKEAVSQEPHESPKAPMTDEACQTSNIAPSPPTSPSRHREELPEAHEPSPALPTVTHVEERVSSLVHQQDATVDHEQAVNLGGMPQETISDEINQVDATQVEHLRTADGSVTTFQEQTLHPPSEPGIGSPFGGFAGEPIPWGSSVPYPTLPPSHGFPMDSFIPHQQPSLYPDLSQTFAPSFQRDHMPESLPPALGEHEAAGRPAEPQTQQSEPYVVSSDVESTKGDTADGGPSVEAEGEQQPMRLEENIKTLIPEQQTKDEGAEAVGDTNQRPGPEMTSRMDEDMDVEEAESFPSDDGDEGGDYDTRNYENLQDNDEGSDIDEDHEDYGEMDEDVYDEDENYDQEGEYDDEGEGYDEQEEYEDWEEAGEAAAPSASSAPVFIDLISDSEDEDQGPSKAVDQKDDGRVEAEEAEEGVNIYEEANASVRDQRAGAGAEDGYSEEESYSDEESEDEAKSQEGSEEEGEEDDENPLVVHSSERTSLSGQYDGADDIPSHAPVVADQDKNEGAEDVDMVSKRHSVDVLSSPPPDEPTSRVATQAVEQPVPTESTETRVAEGADRHEPETGPEPSEVAEVTIIDDAQDDAQAAGPREAVPSSDREAKEPSTQEETAGSPGPAPLPDGEAREPSTQEQTRDVDVQMASPAAEPSIPQAAASPSDTALEPAQGDEEYDEVEIVETEPGRESLDDEVQADIERQMEDSFAMEPNGASVPTAGADEQPREESDEVQPQDEAKAGKETSRPLGTEALASPPLTQATQSQADAEGAAHEEGILSGHLETDHLLTPNATQLASASQSFEEPVTMDERGGSTGAGKVTLGSPTTEAEVPEVKTTSERARRGVTSPTTESFTSQTAEGKADAVPPGSAEGFAITVKSLRSRRHRSVSTEKKEPSKRDPSARLARDSLVAREKSSAKRDPSTQLAKASAAARRSLTADGTPQTSGRTTRSKTRSIQMSASPEPRLKSPELGDAAESEKESQSILKLQLNKNLRLSLLDLTALKVLRTNVNRKIDVLGVATAQPPNPQRPKHGPRDYLLPLTIADQTTAPNSVVSVQVFRPHIESLPLVKEGDVVLLRQFTVTAIRGRDFGLRSCEASSWAVWERDREDGLPQIKGPPVEVSGEEGSQAGLLLRWYAGLDGRAREKLGRANVQMGHGGVG